MSSKVFVTGCDKNTEWSLPWFLENYRKHNTLPICIVDFGMTDETLKWCKENFDEVFDARGKINNKAWFAKPLAINLATDKYEQVCWMDTDCQILGNLESIFGYIKEGKMTVCPDLPWMKRKPSQKWFNTGVIALTGKPVLFREWFKRCMNLPNNQHRPMYGDQNILAEMLINNKVVMDNIVGLPNKYNVLRIQIQEDKTIPKDVLIYHWTGRKGDREIKRQMGLKEDMNRVNIIGNGDQAVLFNEDKTRTGRNLVCNIPPFEVENVYASVIVDFKMMRAMEEGSVNLDKYHWVLGTRPKMHMHSRQSFYLKYAGNVRDFYTDVPKYAGNATNFNCGHVATHYACRKFYPTEVHMYGFDSLFESTVRSYTDLVLNADRTSQNQFRLAETWRPIWQKIFKQFSDIKFVLHHTHDHIKFPVADNVEIRVHKKEK